MFLAGDKKPLLLFGWMYERYESKYYWYEISVLAGKTAFVVVAAFLVTDPVMQVRVCMCLCGWVGVPPKLELHACCLGVPHFS